MGIQPLLKNLEQAVPIQYNLHLPLNQAPGTVPCSSANSKTTLNLRLNIPGEKKKPDQIDLIGLFSMASPRGVEPLLP
ncbi:MAG: hypothetical protein ABW074_06200, partial [Sedimenticola sp.]